MNKKITLLLLILLSICAISHVSAANDTDIIADGDADSTALEINEIVDEQISDCNTDELINEGENQFREIQQKIDDAEEGSTINLTGEYECDYLIIVNKSVNIVGTGEGANIKWTGDGKDYNSPFFHIKSSNVSLTNINFIGGIFPFGGAITWEGDNGLISNCEFRDNIASSTAMGIGGAIVLVGNNCTIENSRFINNQAYLDSGAIEIIGDNATIINCRFENNAALSDYSHGGAITVGNRSDETSPLGAKNCTIKDSIFINNHGIAYGGAISALETHNLLVTNCEFRGNYVTMKYEEGNFQGGGAIFSLTYGLIIDKCNFTGNYANESLGGAVSVGIDNIVRNSNFKENHALHVNDIFSDVTAIIENNNFTLPFMGEIVESVYGISEEDLINANNTFIPTKVASDVKFSAGMIFEYGKSGKISVDVDGGYIEPQNIRVLNHPEAKITYLNKILTVSGLAVGKYTLRVTTTPYDDYNAVDGDLPITVNKATAVIKASKITVALKKGTLWTIKLVDSKTGNPIKNMKLTLKVFTGKKYKTQTVKTNSKGEANYQTKKLTKGSHKIIVSGSDASYNFNTLTSSIKVVKQTPLKFSVNKNVAKDGSSISITVKKGKKAINGIKIKVEVYTGAKLTKTVILKSKTKDKHKGVTGWGTNKLSAGNHKIVVMPANIKYGGSKTLKLNIKKSALKYPKWETKV